MSNFQLNSEHEKMAEAKPPTDRLQVMLALKTHAFLKLLGDKGTHGTGTTDAAKTLIEKGIREAIRDGFLSAQDVEEVERGGK